MLEVKQYHVKTMLFIFSLGAFISILNQTLLFTAFPGIMRTFSVSSSTVQWLTTAYMLVNGVWIPVTAYLISRFSTRQLMLFALGSFTLGTLLSAISPSFLLLLISRLIQAIGAGIIIPLMQVVMFSIVDKDKHGSVMGIIGLTTGFAPLIGPTVAGFILSRLTWRYLFWLVFPIGVALIVATIFGMQNVGTPQQQNNPLDYRSVVYSTLGFGILLYGTGSFNQNKTLGTFFVAIGVIFIVIFIHRELQLAKPMLNFRVFKNRQFSISLVLVVLSFVTLIGPQAIIPTLIQSAMHHTALTSALVLLPGALASGLTSLIAGRLYDHVGGKILGIIGSLVVSISMVPFLFLNIHSSLIMMAACLIFKMMGNSLVMTPLTTEALNVLPERLLNHGSAMVNTLRQVGGSIGTGLLVTVQSFFDMHSAFIGARAFFSGIIIIGLARFVLAMTLKPTIQTSK
ncbi:DHA2 family efflux MFS transporter permease subunit [Secundilactobacillus mixtipabuli]|uniref:Major facilitator superfamily transporter n=1 Tax=Secundilactobacillus mixtipabuli TaxID=1435342 RepID=A0A1Z5ICX4_9LACO|nr:DHA2 family efflux MFS transporter permease subunit [Secundilactobacillus mixtipabuli]GAW99574.1 major facilitator superfamily transporter [Secundilactobacillus mixtipabuli]